MSKSVVYDTLKKRIANANKNGKPYVVPSSYNAIWSKKADKMVEKKVARREGNGLFLNQKAK